MSLEDSKILGGEKTSDLEIDKPVERNLDIEISSIKEIEEGSSLEVLRSLHSVSSMERTNEMFETERYPNWTNCCRELVRTMLRSFFDKFSDTLDPQILDEVNVLKKLQDVLVVRVIESDVINAYSIRGSATIMITTAMLSRLRRFGSMDSLSLVLGHELGHIIFENVEAFQEYNQKGKENKLLMEYECDRFGLFMTEVAGLNVKFANYEFMGKSMSEDVGFFSTHPHRAERDKYLKELVLNYGYANYSETPNYFDQELELIDEIDIDGLDVMNKTFLLSGVYNFCTEINSVEDLNKVLDGVNFESSNLEYLIKVFNPNSYLFEYSFLNEKRGELNLTNIASIIREKLSAHDIERRLKNDKLLRKYRKFSDEELVVCFFSFFDPDLINLGINTNDLYSRCFLLKPFDGLSEISELETLDVLGLQNALNNGDSKALFEFLSTLDVRYLHAQNESSAYKCFMRSLFKNFNNDVIEIGDLSFEEYYDFIFKLDLFGLLSFTSISNLLKSKEVVFKDWSKLDEYLNIVFSIDKNCLKINFLKLHKNQILKLLFQGNLSSLNLKRIIDFDSTFLIELNSENLDDLESYLKLNLNKVGGEFVYVILNNLDNFEKSSIERIFEMDGLDMFSDVDKDYIKSYFELKYSPSFSNFKNYIHFLSKIDVEILNLGFVDYDSFVEEENEEEVLCFIFETCVKSEFENKEKLQASVSFRLMNWMRKVTGLRSLSDVDQEFRFFDSNIMQKAINFSEEDFRNFFMFLNKAESLDFKGMFFNREYCGVNLFLDIFFKKFGFDEEKLRFFESLKCFDLHVLNIVREEAHEIEDYVESKRFTFGDYVTYLYLKKYSLLKPKNDKIDSRVKYVRTLINKFSVASNYLQFLIFKYFDQEVFDSLTKEDHDLLLNIFSKESLKTQVIRRMYFLKYENEALNYEESKDFILKCFPVASIYRDELLSELILRGRFNPNKLVSVDKSLFTKYNAEAKRNETLVGGTIGSFVRSESSREKLKIFTRYIFDEYWRNTNDYEEYSGLSRTAVRKLLFQKENRDMFIRDLVDSNNGMLESKENCETLVSKIFARFDIEGFDQKILTVTKKALISVLYRSSKSVSSKMLSKVVNLSVDDDINFNLIIKEVLVGLGVVGVKLAQVISSQPYVKRTSPDLFEVLSVLKDQAQSMDIIDYLNVLVANTSLKDVDLEVDSILASASIKSVLKGNIDGKDYVVKVLRSNVNKYLTETKKEMDLILDDLRPVILDLFESEIPDLSSEIVEWIQEETDFVNEIINLERLKSDIDSLKLNLNFNFHIPEVRKDLSNFNMIVEDIVPGVPLKSIDDDELKTKIYKDLQVLIVQQIFADGFFHADLHDGNIFYDKDTRTVSLIDAGFCTHISQDLQILILNLLNGDDLEFTLQRYFAFNTILVEKEIFSRFVVEIKEEKSLFGKMMKVQDIFGQMNGVSCPSELTRVVAGLTKCAYIFDEFTLNLKDLTKQFSLARSIYSVSPYFVEKQLSEFLQGDNSLSKIGNILTGCLNLSCKKFLDLIIEIIDYKIANNDGSEISVSDFIPVISNIPKIKIIQERLGDFGLSLEVAVKFITGEIQSTDNAFADVFLNNLKNALNDPEIIRQFMDAMGVNDNEENSDEVEVSESEVEALVNESGDIDLEKFILKEDRYQELFTHILTLSFEDLINVDFENLDPKVSNILISRINGFIFGLQDYEYLNFLGKKIPSLEKQVVDQKLRLIREGTISFDEVLNIKEDNQIVLSELTNIVEDYLKNLHFVHSNFLSLENRLDVLNLRAKDPVLDSLLLSRLISYVFPFEYLLEREVRSEIMESYLKKIKFNSFIIEKLVNYDGDLNVIHYDLLDRFSDFVFKYIEKGNELEIPDADTKMCDLISERLIEKIDLLELDLKDGYLQLLNFNPVLTNFYIEKLRGVSQLPNKFSEILKLLNIDNFKPEIVESLVVAIDSLNIVFDLEIGEECMTFFRKQIFFRNIRRLTIKGCDKFSIDFETLIESKENNKRADSYFVQKTIESCPNLEDISILNIEVFHPGDFDFSDFNGLLKRVSFQNQDLESKIRISGLGSECEVLFPHLKSYQKIKIDDCKRVVYPAGFSFGRISVPWGVEKVKLKEKVFDVAPSIEELESLELDEFTEIEILNIQNQDYLNRLNNLPENIKKRIRRISCNLTEIKDTKVELAGFYPSLKLDFPSLVRIESELDVLECDTFNAPNLEYALCLRLNKVGTDLELDSLEKIGFMSLNCSGNEVRLLKLREVIDSLNVGKLRYLLIPNLELNNKIKTDFIKFNKLERNLAVYNFKKRFGLYKAESVLVSNQDNAGDYAYKS